MKILAFDASAAVGAVALTEDGNTVFSLHTQGSHTHSETLLPLAAEALGERGADGVDMIACAVGPGSFTGVRIAVSLAKGIAAPRGLPCVGVSSLEALAEPYENENAVVCAMIDARRGNVYNALFDGGRRLCPDRLISLDELGKELAALGRPVILTGDALSAAHEHFALDCVKDGSDTVDGAAVARIAMKKYDPENKEFTAAMLRPEYLRPSQAERERKEREHE